MRTVLSILSLVFVLAICNIAGADVVTLVDGDSYKGIVIEETDDFIALETEDGIMEINREDIDSIEMQTIEQEGVEEEETFPLPDREAKDELGVEEEGIGAQEPTEEVVEEVEKVKEVKEVPEEEPIEQEEEEGGPITIKPKITGSGTYKTY